MFRHILILALGSRGDTQPCVTLGAGLRARGHRVGVVANPRYAARVTGAGLEHVPISVDPLEILQSDEGQEWLRGGRNPVNFLRGSSGSGSRWGSAWWRRWRSRAPTPTRSFYRPSAWP